MIEVTIEATKVMADYLKDKDTLPVRIYLKLGGCGMHSFGVVQEAAQPADKAFAVDGISYIIEPRLLKQYSPIKIDSDGFSFRISGKGIHPPIGCGTCGYGCGSRGGHRCTGVCFSCEDPCPTGKRIKSRRKSRIPQS